MRYFFWGITLFLVGCTTVLQNHPPIIKKQELAFTPQVSVEEPFVPIQRKSDIPQKFPASFRTKVSISLTEQSSIKSAIATLASEAHVNYRVTGLQGEADRGVFLSITNRPFIEVIEMLCELAQLRYSVTNDVILIEPDTPYLNTYTVSFPTQIRESENSVSVETNVFTAGVGKDESRQLGNGSTSILKSSGKSDFWKEIEQVINAALAKSDRSASGEIVSLHKQAGLVSVIATRRQHKMIEEYLERLRLMSTAQVLIEAKILEVVLSDAYRGGINWQSLHSHFVAGLPLGTAINNGTALTDVKKGSSDLFTLGVQEQNISAIAHFMENFGSVRTLSSPRLTVMNNQTAVMKVAKNEIFFRIEYHRNFSNSATGKDSETAVSHIQSVPIGLVMTVQPAINLETGDVVLTLRPTISRIAGTKEDPSVSYLSQVGSTSSSVQTSTIKSTIPVVEVREMDSVLTLHSGEVALLGGLMQERSKGARAGVPQTGDVPLIGDLLGAQERESEKTELIILLRVRIVPVKSRHESVSQADRYMMEKFGRDSRPFPIRR